MGTGARGGAFVCFRMADLRVPPIAARAIAGEWYGGGKPLAFRNSVNAMRPRKSWNAGSWLRERIRASNSSGMPPTYELHARARRNNPHGNFADWNHNVTCQKQPLPIGS